jgi:hypothetical protein
MVSLAVALQRAENTIDDVDYIINMIIFIVIFQYFINFGHSHSIVNGLAKTRSDIDFLLLAIEQYRQNYRHPLRPILP